MISTFQFADHVLGIVINTPVNKDVLGQVHHIIKEGFAEHATINLVVEMKQGIQVPLNIMIKDLFFKLANAHRFNKIALVTDQYLFHKAMKFKDLIMKAQVRAFSHEDRIKAMNWISE